MVDTTEYVISVPKELWEQFKTIVTKDKTLNEVIVELIDRRIKDGRGI